MICAACQMPIRFGEPSHESLAPYGTVHEARICIARLRAALEQMAETARETAAQARRSADALTAALREQYELAHGLSDPAVDDGRRDEAGCDDRCRRALALIGYGQAKGVAS